MCAIFSHKECVLYYTTDRDWGIGGMEFWRLKPRRARVRRCKRRPVVMESDMWNPAHLRLSVNRGLYFSPGGG